MFCTIVIVIAILYLIILCISDCDLELFLLEKFGKSPSHLKGKVVFITGASSGIGEYTAYALARFGVKLVLTARRINELERVKQKCLELSKGQLKNDDVYVLSMDVTDFSSHENYFLQAVNHFGTVDILLNNAGRSQRAAWETIELAVDKQLFDLNVFAVINLSRIAIKYFNRVGKGHVAVVSSLAGVVGAPLSGTYTGSKHAIHGYFDSLRYEKLNKNLHITLLCPGPTFTNFLKDCFTNKEGKTLNSSVRPTDRRMTAERCGYLNAVALANQTRESWMSVRPLILLTYGMVYYPNFSYWLFKILGPERVFKLRDGREEYETHKD
ncbi:dehydrogenase/reductase SDR family member 7 [Diorhabda carinulata]|uniref:dehydrogenase/reductase SDR family member 7 n=1 Tax=Diorhabda carinulata TaxID=1163345 RepID=UPI00259FE364|nr:dehydrogenase/reductase SDR family member 7 [Diorhabda carinulata]